MTDNSPAKIFLAELGLSSDGSLMKHQTLEGRPGDPRAPGDPPGYRSAKARGSFHEEIGGHPGELLSQEPHGMRGLDTQGSIQTLLILLRKAARLFNDNSIASWNDYLTWDEESIWNEGARVFGSRERTRELIDSLPERESGKNVNIDEVPDKLIRDFYVGNKTKTTEPTKKPPTKARELSPAEESEIRRAIKDLKRLQNAEKTKENQEELARLWLELFQELGLGQLSSDQLSNFFKLSFEEKLSVLEAMLKGLKLGDVGL